MRPRPSRLAPGLALLLLPLLPATGGGVGVAVHELHRTYADLAIEDDVIAGRLRFFKADLERALGPLVHADAATLGPGPEADALVLRYLRDHLTLEADGAVLEPAILRSGEDELDRHPAWWVVVQYQAPGPVATLRVRNTLLFELFDDQRNEMKFVRFPEETQQTVYFIPGEDEAVVEEARGATGVRPGS